MNERARLLALYLCFFLSGIAGLTYEVIWSRYLALFIGSSGNAHIIVLAVYMGGLALGAWLFGRRADRSKNPLHLYVLLELGIGALGLLYPQLFEPVRQLFLGLARVMGLSPFALNAAAIAVATLTLLLPTTLMGGTLPVLGKYLIRSSDSIGRRIASLYYLNSFGAVVGSLLAGFWLLRAFGLEMSLLTAGLLNLGVAAIAWLVGRMDDAPAPGAETLQDEAAPDPHEPANAATIALVVIALSGFASFIYEVAWIRLLTLVLGSSGFSFALMLSAFIFGIALGSAILARKKTDGGYFRILGWCELAIGLTSLLSILTYERLPLLLNQLRTSLVPMQETYLAFEGLKFLLCFATMVVPTVFMGATLPAASRVVASRASSIGTRVGNTFAVNTIGTIAGAAIAGYVLLPQLGIKRTIECAVAINVLLGLWVILKDRTPSMWLRREVALPLAVGVPVLYAIFAPSWDTRIFTAATYRVRTRIADFDSFVANLRSREILYYKDGMDATIAVARDPQPGDAPPVLSLLINGKPDASSGFDMLTQLMIAHLPMMLHPKPETVLVVGLGSGVTAGSATLHGPKRIDVVELIPEVVDAARFFNEVNHDALGNNTVHVTVQDAKTFLQITPRTYDIIINEPTNPWIAGVPGLFSQEYYKICREKLNPGGYFVQWIQAYELLDSTIYSYLNTFHLAFPYSALFNVNGTDLAIVGSLTPFEPDFALMESRVAQPGVRAELEQYGIRGLLPILAMQMVAKNDTPHPYLLLGNRYSDFFPLLEFEAARGFFIGSKAEAVRTIDRRALPPAHADLWIERYAPSAPPDDELFLAWHRSLRGRSSTFDGIQRAWIELWAKHRPDSEAMRAARINIELAQPTAGAAARALAAAEPQGALAFPIAKALHQDYVRTRSFVSLPDATLLRERLEALAKEDDAALQLWAQATLAELDGDAGKVDEAIARTNEVLRSFAEGRRVLPDMPPPQELLLRTAEWHLAAGRVDPARESLAQVRSMPLTLEHTLRLNRAAAALRR